MIFQEFDFILVCKDLDQISSYDNYPITPLSDYEILQNVLLTTRNALGHSRHFKDHYVSIKKLIIFTIVKERNVNIICGKVKKK